MKRNGGIICRKCSPIDLYCPAILMVELCVFYIKGYICPDIVRGIKQNFFTGDSNAFRIICSSQIAAEGYRDLRPLQLQIAP